LILECHGCILPFRGYEIRVIPIISSLRLFYLKVCSFRFSPFCLFPVSVGLCEPLCVSVVFLIRAINMPNVSVCRGWRIYEKNAGNYGSSTRLAMEIVSKRGDKKCYE
jgi:hypothetical protein